MKLSGVSLGHFRQAPFTRIQILYNSYQVLAQIIQKSSVVLGLRSLLILCSISRSFEGDYDRSVRPASESTHPSQQPNVKMDKNSLTVTPCTGDHFYMPRSPIPQVARRVRLGLSPSEYTRKLPTSALDPAVGARSGPSRLVNQIKTFHSNLLFSGKMKLRGHRLNVSYGMVHRVPRNMNKSRIMNAPFLASRHHDKDVSFGY